MDAGHRHLAGRGSPDNHDNGQTGLYQHRPQPFRFTCPGTDRNLRSLEREDCFHSSRNLFFPIGKRGSKWCNSIPEEMVSSGRVPAFLNHIGAGTLSRCLDAYLSF
jgi:hypothetical protein